MIWKMVVSQLVAMASLAVSILILRDCAKARQVGSVKWLNVIPFVALTAWAVYLMLEAGEAVRLAPPE